MNYYATFLAKQAVLEMGLLWCHKEHQCAVLDHSERPQPGVGLLGFSSLQTTTATFDQTVQHGIGLEQRRSCHFSTKFSFGWKWHHPILTQLVICVNKRSHYQLITTPIIARGSKQWCATYTRLFLFSKIAKVAFLLFKGQQLHDNGAPLSASSVGAPQPRWCLKRVW